MFKQKPEVPILRYNDSDATLVSKRTCYQGFFRLDEYKVSHKLFSGAQSPIIKREIFERGDAVVLIPYDPDKDAVVMIEQFRPGAMRFGGTPWLLEFVAGMFSENESPQDVAVREAKEEVAILVKEKSFLHKSIAGASIVWDLFYYLVTSFEEIADGQQTESGEIIYPEWKSFDEVLSMCLNGSIQEDRSVAVILKYLLSSKK